MELGYVDLFENAQSVVRQHGGRAVERDQIGSDRLAVDAHEANRQTGRDFSRNAGLEQTDDALFLLTGA